MMCIVLDEVKFKGRKQINGFEVYFDYAEEKSMVTSNWISKTRLHLRIYPRWLMILLHLKRGGFVVHCTNSFPIRVSPTLLVYMDKSHCTFFPIGGFTSSGRTSLKGYFGSGWACTLTTFHCWISDGTVQPKMEGLAPKWYVLMGEKVLPALFA